MFKLNNIRNKMSSDEGATGTVEKIIIIAFTVMIATIVLVILSEAIKTNANKVSQTITG